MQPRPLWQVVLIGFLVGGWLLAALAYWNVRFGRSALPIEVVVQMDGPSGEDGVQVGWEFRGGGFCSPQRGVAVDADRSAWSWEVRDAWVKSLVLAGKPEALREVDTITVGVGRRLRVFNRDTWQAAWKPLVDARSLSVAADWEVRTLGGETAGRNSVFGPFAHLLNWPSDAAILKRVLLHPVVLVFVGLWLLVLVSYSVLRKRPVQPSLLDALVATRIAGISSSEGQRLGPRWTTGPSWWLGGLAVLVACLWFLETPAAFHFTQDDNNVQFLPGMLYGCRAVWAGSVPAWNPHQFLGAPLAEVGTYALTYPLTYVSYALAHHVLDNGYATLEVFCLMHLAGGYCAFWWFSRRLGLAPPLCSAAGLCFALSGYALVAGSFWYYMTPTFLWVPLLGISVLRFAEHDPGWGWILGSGAAVGLYFHAGNVQMWTCAMGVYSIAILWVSLSGRNPRRRLLQALAALTIGVGVAAPLLVPQFLSVQGLERAGGGGPGALDGMHALLLPFPIGETHYWGVESRFGRYFAQIYYAGTVFTLVWLASLATAWIYPRRLGRICANPLCVLALVTLLLSLGDPGVLWYLQAKLPVLEKFTHPVKLLPLFHFFSLSAGAVVVHQLTSRTRSPVRWQVLCFVVVLVLLTYHVSLVRRSWNSFTDVPYPAMPRELDRLLKEDGKAARIVPVKSALSVGVDFPPGLADNYPTVYGIDSLSGLDPLVSFRPEYQQVERRLSADLLDTLRRYGVTHLVLHGTGDSSRLRESPCVSCYTERKDLYRLEALRRYCANREPCYEDREMSVFLLDNTAPIAYGGADPIQSFSVVKGPSRLIVDVSCLPSGGKVVINYLWYRAIRLSADGQRLTSWADDFGRIATTVPPNTRTVTVHYQSPWLLGIALGAAVIAAGMVIAWFSDRGLVPLTTNLQGVFRCRPPACPS